LSDEADSFKPELATEISRGKRLVSHEFVTKMKENLREMTLKRTAARNKYVSCMLVIVIILTFANVVYIIAHVFCHERISKAFLRLFVDFE
jgi:uncharacterized membrane protein